MIYEMTGKVKLIMDLMTFNSGFTKREFVVTVEDGRFPQDIKVACTRDRINLLNALKAGDDVRVQFEIRGHAWNEKYFVDLEATTVEKLDGDGSSVTMDEPMSAAPSAPVAAPVPSAQSPVPLAPIDNFAADDDMPF